MLERGDGYGRLVRNNADSEAAIRENEVNLAQTKRFFKRKTGKNAKIGRNDGFFRQKKGSLRFIPVFFEKHSEKIGISRLILAPSASILLE